MDKLRMQTKNIANENFKKLAELFPNAVTEVISEDGIVERAIDKDVLMQEISCSVVEGAEERYQFTWPDKKKALHKANAPIRKTLRPCREESVDFDNTENLYIEGDNLEVLKLLQETYLGRVKMIYIDPPYNTGNDFVYNDSFAIDSEEWDEESGDYDEEGNRLVANPDSNGRFHTDWLNMIYPRLKLAKNLLSDDGVIFISIDDNEVENLIKLGKEIFGESNYVNALKWKRKKQPSFLSKHIAPVMEYVLVFSKNVSILNKLSIDKVSDSTKKVINISNTESERVFKPNVEVKGIVNGIIPKGKYKVKTMSIEYENDIIVKNGKTVNSVVTKAKFINTQDKIDHFIDNNLLFITAKKGLRRYIDNEECNKEKTITDLLLDWGDNQDSEREQRDIFNNNYFNYSKPVKLIYNLVKSCTSSQNIVLDFFSGSATTAHAVMQLNAEDGGKRKFIMVQLPEETDEKSEAYKAGYKNICEIGKERIRRAGQKIQSELKEKNAQLKFNENSTLQTPNSTLQSECFAKNSTLLDTGFRVLKLDTTNMKDVYYSPDKLNQERLSEFISNIKDDRTPEDLLFQAMLELGALLSMKIEESSILGKRVFTVDEDYIIACFDDNITEEVIEVIAKKEPLYFVCRDSSLQNDSVATNFEQLFKAYSPDTQWRII